MLTKIKVEIDEFYFLYLWDETIATKDTGHRYAFRRDYTEVLNDFIEEQKSCPDKFDIMAAMEHELTDAKGRPVTMLRDQGNIAKEIVKESGEVWRSFVFLKKHPDYPELKCLDDMSPQRVEPLLECNGFCGINDLNERSASELEFRFGPDPEPDPNQP